MQSKADIIQFQVCKFFPKTAELLKALLFRITTILFGINEQKVKTFQPTNRKQDFTVSPQGAAPDIHGHSTYDVDNPGSFLHSRHTQVSWDRNSMPYLPRIS